MVRNLSLTISKPWVSTFTKVYPRRSLSTSPPAGDVDPRRSDARSHQIVRRHPVANAWHASSRLACHHALTEPVSRGRDQATQNRNYHYTVLFKNPDGARYVKALGNKWLGNSQAFWQLYQKNTQNPFGYLVIDHHPRTDEAIRFRTRILLDEPRPMTVLQPTSSQKR